VSQAGKDAQRVADEAAASGHSRLLNMQQKQDGIAADVQSAVRDQDRWRAQWEAEKQDLQRERDELQHSIQVSKCARRPSLVCNASIPRAGSDLCIGTFQGQLGCLQQLTLASS